MFDSFIMPRVVNTLPTFDLPSLPTGNQLFEQILGGSSKFGDFSSFFKGLPLTFGTPASDGGPKLPDMNSILDDLFSSSDSDLWDSFSKYIDQAISQYLKSLPNGGLSGATQSPAENYQTLLNGDATGDPPDDLTMPDDMDVDKLINADGGLVNNLNEHALPAFTDKDGFLLDKDGSRIKVDGEEVQAGDAKTDDQGRVLDKDNKVVNNKDGTPVYGKERRLGDAAANKFGYANLQELEDKARGGDKKAKNDLAKLAWGAQASQNVPKADGTYRDPEQRHSGHLDGYTGGDEVRHGTPGGWFQDWVRQDTSLGDKKIIPTDWVHEDGTSVGNGEHAWNGFKSIFGWIPGVHLIDNLVSGRDPTDGIFSFSTNY